MTSTEQQQTQQQQQHAAPLPLPAPPPVTEAQLRWAQFHHRRRAVQVKAAVKELWLTPATVDEVEGALSADGNSSEGSSSSSSSACSVSSSDAANSPHQQELITETTTTPPSNASHHHHKRNSRHGRRRRKPKISRGRRALLRVSQRAYMARCREIQQHGYGFGDGSDDYASQVGSNVSNNCNEDDALAAIFAEDAFIKKTKQRRRRRRRQHYRYHHGAAANSDQARVQRFEEAFHTLMMNLHNAQAQQALPEIQTPAKRWTRPEGLESMDTVDGRAYADLKWGVQVSTKKKAPPPPQQQQQHLLNSDAAGDGTGHGGPEFSSSSSSSIDNGGAESSAGGDSSSPVRKRFRDIVDEFHQRILHQEDQQDIDIDLKNAPTMRLSKYFIPTVLADDDDDDDDDEHDEKKNDDEQLGAAGGTAARSGQKKMVRERVAAFEGGGEEQLGNVLASLDPELLSEMEALDPGVIDRLRAFYLGESSPEMSTQRDRSSPVQSVKTKLEESNASSKRRRPGLVQRLVDRMEKAVHQEHLISADGKLHKAAFAHLLNTYLVEACPPGEAAAAAASKGVAAATTVPKKQSSQQQQKQGLSRTSSNSELAQVYLESVENSDSNNQASSGKLPLPPPTVRLIDTFVTKMNETAELSERMVDADGNFDKREFETIVARYLAEASGTDEATVLQADDLESLGGTAVSWNNPEQPENNGNGDNDEHYESFMSTQQIQQFIHTLVQAAEVDPLVTSDGKLHKPTFEKLVHRHLVQQTMPQPSASSEDFLSNARSPLALATARKSIASVSRNRLLRDDPRVVPEEDDVSGPESPGFIKRFIEELERATEEQCIVDAQGNLDKVVFEELAEQYLRQATTKRISVKQDDNDDGIMANLVQKQAPFSPEPGANVAQKGAENVMGSSSPVRVVSPGESSFFDRLRRADPDNQEECNDPQNTAEARTVVSDLTHETGPPASDHRVDDSRPTTTTARAAGDVNEGDASRRRSVSTTVGGFIQRFYKREEPSAADDDDNNSTDALRAVAAFRKTRDEHREANGSTATNSTFQVLPDGIKRVVQNFRGNALSPKSEDEEDEEDASFTTPEIPRTPGSRASGLGSRAIQANSSGDRTPSSFNASDITPERARMFHQKVMERSALIGGAAADRSIIDTDGSDTSGPGMNPDVLASLMLSPTILTKRHQQAIRAIEKRNWEQVAYLTNANPWLAEMTDFKTNQYLLHKLALYGAGEVRIDERSGVAIRHPAAPMQVNTDIVRLFPSSVHKFDQDGNLPLHMASASANAPMARVLGDRFPSGATVLNEDGLLPIHLAILACASPRTLAYSDPAAAVEMIQTVMDYFPGAVAVSDNDGNLPIHTAASALKGEVGVDVIYLLLDEAENQLASPSGARFRNKIKVGEDADDRSDNTLPTETPTDSSHTDDEFMPCTLIRNDNFHTPLLAAIYARAGWQVIEALVQGSGGAQAARATDGQLNNALHLIVSERFKDPASVLSILKAAPETTSCRNEDRVLPIEIACMQMLPREVILAMALVDLPIDLDRKDSPKLRDGHGGSWWYLTCECDDHYVDIVEEIVSICSFAQVREMCFMSGPGGESLISRATPRCMSVMQRSLRFLGRFEFVGKSPIHTDPSLGIKMFDALDYGTDEDPFDQGKPIILKCYSDEEVFADEIELVGNLDLDFSLLEEISIHSVDRESSYGKQYCVSIEQPELTLQDVVSGMLENDECQTDVAIRKRYAGKVFSVLRIVAKGLSHLHSLGVIHGCVSLEHVGKFQAKWKLSEIMIMQRIGQVFDSAMLSKTSPPEAIQADISNSGSSSSTMEHRAIFRSDFIVDESIDIWAFGNMAFEVLVGEPLANSDPSLEFDQDHGRLLDIMHWGEVNLEEVSRKLHGKGVSDSGIDLITSCLSSDARNRPSAAQILSHPVWKELRREKGS